MKAIVQSCDRYHSIAQNMLFQYKKLWPSSKFTFRIPWNLQYPETIASHFSSKTELIKTGIKFKETFYGLTQDLDDNEWVYWCIDDKYPINIQERKANKVFDFVTSISDPNIINVSFHFVREIESSANSIKKEGSGRELRFKGLRFIEHKSFTNNWLHQFFRVKALREFWSNIKEPDQYQAKQMDYDVQPLTGISLTLDHNICTYGESTDKGSITKNCEDNCIENNIAIPDYFLPALPISIII
jgi:hypothetical protein